MNFLDLFKHLLPNAKAWRITIEKNLRRFFEGLSDAPANARDFIDDVYRDLFPQTTRDLDSWEDQFALPDTISDEQERRDRLAAAWQALGGQSPRYIQDTLQGAGFPVFIHEWWEPGSNPPVARIPQQWLVGPIVISQMGDVNTQMGDPLAYMGRIFGSTQGALVNKIGEKTPIYMIPSDPTRFPFFIYLGAEVFPGSVDIPIERKDEFETLCLQICPSQLWIGLLVNYV